MSQAAVATPAFSYDPFSYEAMHNPMPLYEVLREHYPVYHLPQYDAFAISRFEDVYQIFKNDESFHTAEGSVVARDELLVHRRGQGLSWNPDPLPVIGRVQSPLYEQVRQAMTLPLRPRPVAQVEADVRARTRTLLDELLAKGQFDVVKEFVGIIAAGTVCMMCGIAVERAGEVLAAANFAAGQDPVAGGFPNKWLNNREPLLEICREAVRNHLDKGEGGLPAIDGLAAIRFGDGSGSMSVNNIAMQMSSILSGGSETIPKVIAYGLMEIAKDPKQRKEILSDLTKNIPLAFEEMLRFCGPAQWFMRTVKAPVVIGGQQLEVGQRVFALIQSANRDEREFPDADKFIWNRKIARHVGLGHGARFCIGSHLARAEGRIILEELLSRVPDYRIVDAMRSPSSFQMGYTSAKLVPEKIAPRS